MTPKSSVPTSGARVVFRAPDSVPAGAVHRFLEEGDKVKVTMRFRGREMVHQEIGMKVLDKVRTDLDAVAKVESHPRLEGRQMVMVVAPK